MDIIDAFWDTKSLDVKTYEVLVKEESPLEIHNTISEIRKAGGQYIVVKAPVLKPDVYRVLRDLGLVFVEAQLHVMITKHWFKSIYDRYAPVIVIDRGAKVTTQEQLDEILVLMGDTMFTTDRIALHPRFGVKQANIRYKEWIKSSFGKPDILITSAIREGKPISFGMYKVREKVVHGLLGGVFDEYKKDGFFTTGTFSCLVGFFNSGFRSYKTSCSANNLDVVKIFDLMGFQITGMNYVFHTVDW